METKINEILEELYLLDPELKKEEELIKKILIDMYAVRPNIVADNNFVMSLRKMILERAYQLSQEPVKIPMFKFLPSRFVMAGLVVALLVIIPTLFLSGFNLNNIRGPVAKVNNLNENAFGPLAYQLVEGGRGGGGGGGGTIMSMTAPQTDAVSGKEMTSSLIYPGPEFTQTIYRYEGDDFELLADGFAYKRKINSISGRSIVNTIRDLPVSKLKNPIVSDMSISEDREYGYTIAISLRDGFISFFQNWERWPNQDTGCSSDECYRREFIAQEQFPADNEVLAIADAFLKEYGIDMSDYGAGEVIKPWKFGAIPMSAVNARETSPALYSPDINIIYPILIEGVKVYDEWGNPVGVNVGVNLKYNRVSSASNISIRSYDKSKYTLTTDKDKIMQIAGNGGITGDIMVMNWEGRKMELKIGTPEKVFMQFYMYSNGKSDLIYVPALRFPITDIPKDASFYKENVIVPLASDIINDVLLRKISPPMPMPLINEGGGAGGSAPGVSSPTEVISQ